MIATASRKDRVEAVIEALRASEEWEFALEDRRSEALALRFEAARQRRLDSSR